ncbi:MAG: transglycosylase domain-containing protein, partial [Nocardioidaceae bacterium]|nr:transglycosylase domain-containing protein [Nocardioidaceae bacterium]
MSSTRPGGNGAPPQLGRTGSGKGGKTKMRDLAGWAKARHAAKKTLKWGAIIGLVTAVAGAIAVYIIYKSIDLPDPNRDFQTEKTTVFYSDGKHVLGGFALQNRESVELDEVPVHMQDAVISAEDQSFETNQGLDPKGIVRAAWKNVSSETEQGASTITQQYVKILYLSSERTWERKIKEAFLAVKVQNTLSKDQILEGYLNTIYYGRGAYGVQAASQAYFRKDAKDLTIPESAALASIINSPGTFDPAVGKDNRQRLLERYNYVINGMVELGRLGEAQAAKFEGQLPKFPEVEEQSEYGGQRGHLLTLVREHLVAQGFAEEEISGGGLQVVTTLDWQAQRAAGRATREVPPKGKEQLHVALASIEPGTGALRAMIGGEDFLGENPQAQVNFATSPVPPGSAFKPFALTAGLESGFTLEDRFNGNSPYYLPNGETIENQGENAGESLGYISLTTATQESVNTAYMDMVMKIGDSGGIQQVIDASIDAGVPASSPGLDKPFPSVVLGSASVAPVEMAESYGTFAALGEQASWYLIEKVSDASGVRLEHKLETERAFDADIVSNVTYALQQVITPEGTGYNALELERPAAGKTGTATGPDLDGDGEGDVVSSWFVGYTPQLSTAVMMVRGNSRKPLNDGYIDTFYGGGYPAMTWTRYMKAALRGLPVEDFPDPATLDREPATSTPPSTRLTPTAPTGEPSSSTTPEPPSSTATNEPPTTTKPTTEPPTSDPPTSDPPTSDPPTSDPPTTDPPTSDPPTSDPPTTDPPTSDPPTTDPPT